MTSSRDFSVSNIFKSFGEKEVLRGVTFTIQESCIAGLIGPSGGGKSILLKIIAGVSAAGSGQVDTGLRPGEEHSLMFQEGALFDSLSVFDNVAFPLVGGRVPASLLSGDERDEVRVKVSEILGHVGLSKAAHKMPAQISGGMRRRASLARAVVARPKLLLLDDPTSGLDPVASSVIMNLIVDLHKEYRPTTLIVSHDLRRLLPVVETTVALFDGRAMFCGEVSKLLSEASDEVKHFVACRYDLRAGDAAKPVAP